MDCQADFIAKRAMINDLIDLLNFKGIYSIIHKLPFFVQFSVISNLTFMNET